MFLTHSVAERDAQNKEMQDNERYKAGKNIFVQTLNHHRIKNPCKVWIIPHLMTLIICIYWWSSCCWLGKTMFFFIDLKSFKTKLHSADPLKYKWRFELCSTSTRKQGLWQYAWKQMLKLMKRLDKVIWLLIHPSESAWTMCTVLCLLPSAPTLKTKF